MWASGNLALSLIACVEARKRLVVAPHGGQREALVEQNLRRRLFGAHRLGDQLEGLGRLALGELDEAQHVQRVEMVGPDGQDRGVEGRGLVEAALLVQIERLRQRLRHIERLIVLAKR